MDPDLLRLAAVFPSIAVQLRGILSNLHLASAQLAPPAEREADPELDAKAALLDQSYYQLLRLVNNLSATTWLHTEGPLPLCNRDVVRVIGELCQEAESLAAEKGLHFYFRCALSSHLCAIHEEGMEQLLRRPRNRGAAGHQRPGPAVRVGQRLRHRGVPPVQPV